MIYLTYCAEYNPRNSLFFELLNFAYNMLIQEIFQLGEREGKEALRKSHMHNWNHRAQEYRRGTLSDDICQHEEQTFKGAKAAAENTNRKVNICSHIVRQIAGTAAWQAEHGRNRVYGQDERSWQAIWARSCKMPDFIVPERWMGRARDGEAKTHYDVFLHRTRAYNTMHWSENLPGSSGRRWFTSEDRSSCISPIRPKAADDSRSVG
jgi:hypothetical protein